MYLKFLSAQLQIEDFQTKYLKENKDTKIQKYIL